MGIESSDSRKPPHTDPQPPQHPEIDALDRDLETLMDFMGVDIRNLAALRAIDKLRIMNPGIDLRRIDMTEDELRQFTETARNSLYKRVEDVVVNRENRLLEEHEFRMRDKGSNEE